jgi:hypothetical protein
MSWLNIRSILALWNGGTPVQVSNADPVPITAPTTLSTSDANLLLALSSLFSNTYIEFDETIPDNGSFITGWIPTADVQEVDGVGIASQYSAIDGVFVEWSATGLQPSNERAPTTGVGPYTEMFFATDGVTFAPNVPLTFTFSPAAKYMRIVYLNGATTARVLGKIVLRTTPAVMPQGPMLSSISDLGKALLARQVPFGRIGTDNYAPQRMTASQNMGVAVGEFEVEVPIKALTGWKAKRDVVGTTATRADVSPLVVNRKTVKIQSSYGNADGTILYVAATEAEAAANNAEELAPGDFTIIEITAAQSVWVKGSAADIAYIISEIA